MIDVLRGLLGLAVLVAIGIALSENRSAIQPRVVLSALALQVAQTTIALLLPGAFTLEPPDRRPNGQACEHAGCRQH